MGDLSHANKDLKDELSYNGDQISERRSDLEQ